MSKKTVKEHKFTPKKKRFADEYLVDLNATQAIKRAGFKVKNDNVASVIGSRLLGEVKVAAYIQAKKAQLEKATDNEAWLVLQENRRLSLSDARKLFRPDGSLKEMSEMDDETAACIASVEVEQLFEGTGKDRKWIGCTKKIKLWDKNAAHDKRFRYLALYHDVGSKNNPLHVLHGRIDLSTLPSDELARIRDNPEYAASILSRN